MNPLKGIGVVASALGILLGGSLSAQQAASATTKPTQLVLTTQPRLVDCAPVTLVPCMSAGLTPSDASGRAAPVALPAARELAAAVTLQSANAQVKPFYASAGTGIDSSQRTNVVLLMVDISGSMNEPSPGAVSRFAAVKGALSRYLDGMQEGSDRVAIVPFESHNVVSTIRAAVFSTRKSDALAQLNALPQPGPKNNTALYQAVFSGVDALRGEVSTLQGEGHTAQELQPHLVVMTDGKNEVAAGDDTQLLNGPLGLQQAAAQVTSAHFDVIGVGFGNQAAIDANALQHLSTRFFYAADADQLLNALHATQSALSHEVQMTWMLPESTRTALAGRDQIWTPTLQVSGESALQGAPIRIVMPATAAPLFQRAASPAELLALIAVHPPANAGWTSVFIHLLLFLAAISLLLALWFWVPRLVWGERYLRAVPNPARWSSERPATKSASAVQIRSTSLPPGFDEDAQTVGALQRSPAQTTQVGLRGDTSRNRLN